MVPTTGPCAGADPTLQAPPLLRVAQCPFTYVRLRAAPPVPKTTDTGPIPTATRSVGAASIRSSSRATTASQAPYAAVEKADPPSQPAPLPTPGVSGAPSITDPSSAWLGYAPQARPSSEELTRSSHRKGTQKGSRIRSKSRRVLADSSGWERGQGPARMVIDDSTPRSVDAVSPHIVAPTTDDDWPELLKMLRAYYPRWEDATWQLRRFARTVPTRSGRP